MVYLHPAVTVTVNGIPRRTTGGSTSTGFRSAFGTASVMFAADEDPAQPGDIVAITLGYQESGGQLVFVGEVDDDTLDYWPNRPGVTCSGFLARLQRGLGVAQAGAPEDDAGNAPAYYAEDVTDDAIANALLALYGVAGGDIQGDTPVQTFGTIEPVRLGKDTPAWQLLAELDRLTFMRTFDGPDGLVRRLPINTKPAAASITLTEAVNLLSGNRGRSRRPIINRVTMTGLANADGLGDAPSAERYADPPVVNGRPLIPDPPKYQSEEWQSDLAETEECCDRYAARRVDQLNRLAETIQVRLDRCRPDIRPAQSLAIVAPHFHYDSRYIMWVEQVEHQWDARSAHTTLGLIVATAEAGINPNLPPVPVIRYTIEQEYADGAKIWIVRADGRDSYDPDSIDADLDPQHGITTYLWSGNPNDPVTPAGLPQATYVYASDPTGAQICLTVGDVQLKLATACVTITAQDVKNAVIRDLWAAVTSDLLISIDGGGTWAGVGVAAVGCCEQAHPSYQLAWTAGGDLWRVTLSDDGLTYAATLVLPGKGITAASINLGFDGTGTRRCWAAGAGRKVYQSINDGVGWAEVGTIPDQAGSSNTVNAIEESPFASGDLSATCGNAIVHSFDGGATWTVLRAYADAALTATRLASGRYADLTVARSYRWATFAGTSGNTLSRILEAGSQESVDWPTGAKPAQPSGLTLGLDGPAIYATDTGGAGTGRTWALADFTGGGTLTQQTYNVAYGPPRHIIRDGAIDQLIYGAADAAIWKSYDGFATVVRLLALVSPRVGKMVGFGRLRHAPVPAGDLYVSAMLSDTNQTRAGVTANTILRWHDGAWAVVSDHPIAAADNGTLLGGMGICPFGSCTAATGANSTTYQFPRPLVRDLAGNFYTYAFALQSVVTVTRTLANLYRSTDNCATWESLAGVTGVTSLAVAVDGALWAVVGDGTAIARSADHGDTWDIVVGGRPAELFPPPTYEQFTGVSRWLDRWNALDCSPNSAGGVVVISPSGFMRTTNAFATKAFTALKEGSLNGGSWGPARSPVDDATILARYRLPPYATYRVPDGTATGDDTMVVLGATVTPASGQGLGGNAYRRLGGRTVFLGPNATEDSAGFGDTFASTDDGRGWGPLFAVADLAALMGGIDNASSRDVAYDAATDTLYAGLYHPATGTPGVGVAFVARTGIGAWRDITGAMVADLGGLYAAHLRGMVAGVPG